MENNRRINILGFVYFLLVTLAGVWLRIWFILAVPTEQLFDFATYQEIAVNVFNHAGHSYRGLPIAWQGPAYPLVLGYLYRLIGNTDLLVGKYFNLLLSLLTLIIFFFLLRKLSDNRFFLWGSYTLAAFLPNFLAYNNVIGTEVFFTFLLMFVLLLQVSACPARLKIPLLGVFIGVAALVKPYFLAYPAVVALFSWLRQREFKKNIAILIALLVLSTAVVAPWTYRNYRKFDRFIPVSYNAGYVLYVNNNDRNIAGRWMELQEIPATAELEGTIANILNRHDGEVKLAPELNEILKEAARTWIRENPLAYLRLGFLRLRETYFTGAVDLRSWAMNEVPPTLIEEATEKEDFAYRRGLNFLNSLADMWVYLLSSFGLLYLLANIYPVLSATLRRGPVMSERTLICTLTPAFFVAINFLFEGQARYNYPTLYLFIISMFALLEKHEKIKKINEPVD